MRRSRYVAALCLLLILFACVRAGAQQSTTTPRSIHRSELDAHRHDSSARAPDTPVDERRPGMASLPSRRVFGYRPYWAPANDYLSYDFNALTDLGYFAGEIDTATGHLGALHGWPSAPVIEAVRAHGIKVSLVVVCFDYAQTDKLLGDLSKRTALISSLIDAVKNGLGDGINVDFEAVRASQRSSLVAFIQALADRLHTDAPGAMLSMALPAVDWSSAFDLARLSSICDFVVMMAYDYHYSGSQSAGPVSPLVGESYNVTRSVTTYLSAGVPARKLLLGVPWYGYDWPVADSVRGAATLGAGTAVYYKAAEPAAALYGKHFDAATSSTWYRYSGASGLHQVWYDDSTSLGLKYRLVTEKDLGGIGIWALSYEGETRELWTEIEQAFGTPSGVTTRNEGSSPGIESMPRGVKITMSESEQISVCVYDILGRRSTVLVDGPLTEGSHLFSLDGLPAGAYLIAIRYRSAIRSIGVIVE